MFPLRESVHAITTPPADFAVDAKVQRVKGWIVRYDIAIIIVNRFLYLRNVRGFAWNHKRVYRVYCGMRLNLKRKAKRRLATRERQPLLFSQELNRVWALDFMRDTLYDGRPFRTLNVIDEGNREALRIECGTSIPSARVVRVMDQLVEVYGKPEAVRLDNGPEMISATDWPLTTGWMSGFSPCRVASSLSHVKCETPDVAPCVSAPISRWFTMERLLACRNSIGSSIVMMFACRCSFTIPSAV